MVLCIPIILLRKVLDPSTISFSPLCGSFRGSSFFVRSSLFIGFVDGLEYKFVWVWRNFYKGKLF